MNNKAQSEILGLLLILASFFILFAIVSGTGGQIVFQETENIRDERAVSEMNFLSNTIDKTSKDNELNTIFLERGKTNFEILKGQNITVKTSSGKVLKEIENIGAIETSVGENNLQYVSGNVFLKNGHNLLLLVKDSGFKQEKNTIYLPFTKISSNRTFISGNILASNINNTRENIQINNEDLILEFQGNDSFIWPEYLSSNFNSSRISVSLGGPSSNTIKYRINNTAQKPIDHLNIQSSVISLKQR